VAFFSFDYVVRIVTFGHGRLRWMIMPTHVIDLISILPYYIELIISGITGNTSISGLVVLRVLRLLRVLWTFKIARYSNLVPLFVGALIKSRDGFLLFLLNIAIVMVCVSGVMFYAEQTISTFDDASHQWLYPDGTVSTFQSIPSTFWWFMSTITTVGYGDTYPRSDLGKTVAVFTMVIGILVLAVPVAVFGLNFTRAWDERLDDQRVSDFKRLKIKFTEKNYRGQQKLLRIINDRLSHYSITLVKHKRLLDKLMAEDIEIRQLMVLATSLADDKMLSKFPQNEVEMQPVRNADKPHVTTDE